jgi:hypothetical protein
MERDKNRYISNAEQWTQEHKGSKHRGRPSKNGLQPHWMWERVSLVLFAYDRSRNLANKHSTAIIEAVSFVREQNARMSISESEVKRILARWRSKDANLTLIVTAPAPGCETKTLPNGRICRVKFNVSSGPCPIYPRINASSVRDRNRTTLETPRSSLL